MPGREDVRADFLCDLTNEGLIQISPAEAVRLKVRARETWWLTDGSGRVKAEVVQTRTGLAARPDWNTLQSKEG